MVSSNHRSVRQTFGVLLALLVVGLVSPPVHAHDVDQGYVYLTILDEQLQIRVELNVRDVNRALGLALPEDGSVTQPQLDSLAEELGHYLDNNLSIEPEGASASISSVKYSLRDTEYGQFLMADFAMDDLTRTPTYVDIEYGLIFDAYPDHRGYVLIENDWRSQVYENEARYSLVYSPSNRRQVLKLDDASIWTGILGMIENGAHHIWIGYDHLMFLLALLLPAFLVRNGGGWQPKESSRQALVQVVKIVTMFTVGHSITLGLAALGIVNLSSRFVESIIAASIGAAALDVLYPIFRQRILALIFIFGLVHGFGFANVLAEMPIPSSYVIPSLFGFNVGVELGQLVVVLALVPFLYLLRGSKSYTVWIMPAIAVVLILVSSYWFIERAFDVDLPAGAIIQDVLGMR